MKIKEDVFFKVLRSHSKLSSIELSENIVHNLSTSGVWMEDPELKGVDLFSIAQSYDLDLHSIVEKVMSVKSFIYAFLLGGLTLLGDGDCYNCGGDLTFHNDNDRIQQDFNSEPYHNGNGYYICDNCKTKIEE